MANWSGLYAISAEWVADIPLLGQDVWRGVKQSNVILAVPEGKEDAYASAPQWQDFMIKGVTPGGVDASESPVEGVVARFEGMTLHLSAPVEIAGADLFGIDGRSYGCRRRDYKSGYRHIGLGRAGVGCASAPDRRAHCCA